MTMTRLISIHEAANSLEVEPAAGMVPQIRINIHPDISIPGMFDRVSYGFDIHWYPHEATMNFNHSWAPNFCWFNHHLWVSTKETTSCGSLRLNLLLDLRRRARQCVVQHQHRWHRRHLTPRTSDLRQRFARWKMERWLAGRWPIQMVIFQFPKC